MKPVLHCGAGTIIPLDVERWRAEADEAERALLATLADPVLDVGCGPGRIVAALAAAGRVALGIDPAPRAVDAARSRGAPVLQRSVFDRLPGEGRWGTALLLDGNVGIGGDPLALLRRLRALLRSGGEAVIEVEPPGTPTETLLVQLHAPGAEPGPPFPWARVAADGLGPLAAAADMGPAALTVHDGRWFARVAAP